MIQLRGRSWLCRTVGSLVSPQRKLHGKATSTQEIEEVYAPTTASSHAAVPENNYFGSRNVG
jgi:hypothetical protein